MGGWRSVNVNNHGYQAGVTRYAGVQLSGFATYLKTLVLRIFVRPGFTHTIAHAPEALITFSKSIIHYISQTNLHLAVVNVLCTLLIIYNEQSYTYNRSLNAHSDAIQRIPRHILQRCRRRWLPSIRQVDSRAQCLSGSYHCHQRSERGLHASYNDEQVGHH